MKRPTIAMDLVAAGTIAAVSSVIIIWMAISNLR